MFDCSKSDRENLIRSFVAKTLYDEDPDKKCFTVCYILSVYLSTHNIKHVIRSGTVRAITESIGHYIVTLKNNEGDIDPTAQQIDRNNPQVLMREKLYTDSTFAKIEFDNVYKCWEYPLLHNGSKRPEIEGKKIDIIPYLRILIRAYYVFKNEMFELEGKKQRVHREFVNQFFEKTDKIVIQNKDKSGKFDSNLINSKFDELLDNYKL